MNPREQFCHNPAYWACGESGLGNIMLHDRAQEVRIVGQRRLRDGLDARTLARGNRTPPPISGTSTLYGGGRWPFLSSGHLFQQCRDTIMLNEAI